MLTRIRFQPPSRTGDTRTDLDNLTKAVTDYLLSLEKPDALQITEASVNTTPIGASDPSTGKFTTLEATTSSTFPNAAFTPAIKFGGGDTGVTYSLRAATYTVVGDRVLATGFIVLTAKGSSTGNAAIHGLPFTVANANDAYSAVSLRIENITYTGTPQGFTNINTTQINLEQVTEAGANSALTDANFANNSTIIFRIEYRKA